MYKITKHDNDTYSVAFEAPEGRLTCEVSVARQEGAIDRWTRREKEREARKNSRDWRKTFLTQYWSGPTNRADPRHGQRPALAHEMEMVGQPTDAPSTI